jgi:hypothetical protein
MKLTELRGLLYKHSATFPDFDMILQAAKNFALMGDHSFLDENITFLRTFDIMNRGTQAQIPSRTTGINQSQPGQSNAAV